MRKIRKISDIQPTIGFTEFDIYRDYQQSFDRSELGQLHSVFPFAALAKSFKLKESPVGRTSYFSPEGKIALMILKSYSCSSDESLIEQLNSNIHYQLFCGVRINPLDPLTNFKIVSDIRCELSRNMNTDCQQEVLANHWKPYLENLTVLMTDATCYESHMRYPADVKLLWESVDWVYAQIQRISKSLKLRMARTKYDKQQKRYLSYSKKRNRSQTSTRVLKRSLLHLLNKLNGILSDLLHAHGSRLKNRGAFHKRFSVIGKILTQQQSHFRGEEVKDRIVSIDKHYIRPIVRGKERKSVEFGAKVNTLQVDGINFIEHLSFEAFHEGIRLPQCIAKQQALFRKKVTLIGADALYATNYNRRYCSKRSITTSFVRKGKAGSNEEQVKVMRSMLGKDRSTRLEGSFGTEKMFYSLQKIKARTKPTEILWIFFGIHTANAVRMIPKIERAKCKQAA